MPDLKGLDIKHADIALIPGSGFEIDISKWHQTGSISYMKFIPNHALYGFSDSDTADYFETENKKSVLLFSKRLHRYQGFTPIETVLTVQIAHESDAASILLTNAAGGLNDSLMTGDFVVIDKVKIFPQIPGFLIDAANVSSFESGCPFDNHLSQNLSQAVFSSTGKWNKGTYAFMPGPAYETRAEVDFLKHMKADVVGMSTAYEALYASSMGMRVAGLSLVTNMHSKERSSRLSHMDVLSQTAKSNKTFNDILTCFLESDL